MWMSMEKCNADHDLQSEHNILQFSMYGSVWLQTCQAQSKNTSKILTFSKKFAFGQLIFGHGML